MNGPETEGNFSGCAFPQLTAWVEEDVATGHKVFVESRAGHDGMSIRQYAAIKLRVPNSGVEWLDAMISDSLLNEFAAKALAGLCANPGGPFQSNGHSGWGIVNCSVNDVADEAYTLAKAMLETRK